MFQLFLVRLRSQRFFHRSLPFHCLSSSPVFLHHWLARRNLCHAHNCRIPCWSKHCSHLGHSPLFRPRPILSKGQENHRLHQVPAIQIACHRWNQNCWLSRSVSDCLQIGWLQYLCGWRCLEQERMEFELTSKPWFVSHFEIVGWVFEVEIMRFLITSFGFACFLFGQDWKFCESVWKKRKGRELGKNEREKMWVLERARKDARGIEKTSENEWER